MAERRDRIRVHIEGKEYGVVGGTFQDMLAALKQINGRRFVGELKVWQLPGLAADIQDQLEISGYGLEGGTPVEGMAAAAPQGAQAPSAAAGGDRIRVIVQDHQMAVVGGTFQELLAAVKNLPGRRFDGERKVWEIPGEAAIIKQLVETAGFQLDGAEKVALAPSPASSASVSGAAMPLMPDFGPSSEAPPAYEEPQFFGDDNIPPYEPPDWWDDDNMPPPDLEPPDWLEDEMTARPPEDFVPPVPSSADAPGSTPPGSVSQQDVPSRGGPQGGPRGGDQIRIRVGGIPLVVAGGTFRAMLEVIKKIPGRRFNGQDKVWDIPEDVAIDSVQQVVKGAGFILKR